MAELELPTGFTSIKEFPRAKESLINMMNVGKNKLMQRPGVIPFVDSFGPCRGSIKFQDELYQVSGTKLLKIQKDGAVTNISNDFVIDIAGDAQCVLSVGFTFLVIVVKGDRGYAWDGTTLSEITDPQFISSNDVTYINGRWVFIPSDGSPAFFTDALDPLTIDGFLMQKHNLTKMYLRLILKTGCILSVKKQPRFLQIQDRLAQCLGV